MAEQNDINLNEKSASEFMKVMKDFYKDLLTTFPECKNNCEFELLNDINNQDYSIKVRELYNYCLVIYPEMFFDILYQNEDIFTDTDKNTCFLPNIKFSELWSEDISDKTRQIIWKYLQMLLFIIINEVKDKNSFGDTAKLFEAINEDEFKTKINEALKDMENIFNTDVSGNDVSNSGFNFKDLSDINFGDFPDGDELHNHINNLMGGKIGSLAQEIADETAAEMDIDINDTASMTDIFDKMFKNPGKLMSMVKNIGDKIDKKLKSGEIDEKELMEEASELMNKMKTMPGMKNMDMNSIFSQFGMSGMPGMPKNAKFNSGAFKNKMNSVNRKDRMRKKLDKRRADLIKKRAPTINTNTSDNFQKTPRVRVINKQNNASNPELPSIDELVNDIETINNSQKKKKKRKKKKKQ
jgi:hypothetical protein